jgi:pectin methylesterase-like acyl-CoA thioesterase
VVVETGKTMTLDLTWKMMTLKIMKVKILNLKMVNWKAVCFLLVFVVGCASSHQANRGGAQIVVAQDGSGDFRSIQEAVNSIKDTTATVTRTIFIKNGTYSEKVFLEHIDNVTLRGESEKGVVITQSIARDIFRCQPENKDDWGVATINMRHSDDVTLENLTVLNTFGFEATGDVTVPCPNDPTKQKLVRKTGHQMALRTFPSTKRLIAKHCTFRALGGDTVSPWDLNGGSYYFYDCTMEGGVDFYCPRGWAYAEKIRFIGHNENASIWHDGTGNADAKSVIVNATFEGDNGFALGRYHRDSQIFLAHAKFAANMADRAIYEVPNTPTPPIWGHRIYYADCHRIGGNDFAWHRDNLDMAPNQPKVSDLTAEWTFAGKWHPKP